MRPYRDKEQPGPGFLTREKLREFLPQKALALSLLDAQGTILGRQTFHDIRNDSSP